MIYHSASSFCTAQVEVLSAALRASSLDPQEEPAASMGKFSHCQNEVCIKDELNCSFIQAGTVPLINDAVEVKKRKKRMDEFLNQYSTFYIMILCCVNMPRILLYTVFLKNVLFSPHLQDIVESTLRYIHSDSDLNTNSCFSPEEEKKSKIQVYFKCLSQVNREAIPS